MADRLIVTVVKVYDSKPPDLGTRAATNTSSYVQDTKHSTLIYKFSGVVPDASIAQIGTDISTALDAYGTANFP